MKLTAKRWTVEASYTSLYEFADERGWTDGLPIIPPTAELVTGMLEGTRRDPSDVVAILPPRNGKATVEKIAINAVMAGCKPEYMPILVTAVAAIGRPQVNLIHIQTSTSPAAPLTIVHGPIAEKVGMNCGSDALGPGKSGQRIHRASYAPDPDQYRRRDSRGHG